MANTRDDIERLISRSLDGELTGDEELALNREILRNPAARRLLDEHRLLDELSADVLGDVVPERERVVAPARPVQRSQPRRVWASHLAWWLLPGAMAAALAVAIVSGPESMPTPSTPRIVEQLWTTPKIGSDPIPTAGAQSLIHNVSDRAPRRRIIRDTHREMFGVIGEDGNIYWIEVDRTRTIKRPYRGSARNRRNEEL